jgi:hypothetical protein
MAMSNPAASLTKTVRLGDTTNPFIGMNVMGFEPTEVTIEKVLKKRRHPRRQTPPSSTRAPATSPSSLVRASSVGI